MKRFRSDSGMSGIDLITMFLVVGALISVAIPAFLASSERATSATCAASRLLVTQQLEAYRKVRGGLPASMGQLVEEKFMQTLPECPSHGTHVMHVNDDGTAEIYCSVHYVASGRDDIPSDDPAVSGPAAGLPGKGADVAGVVPGTVSH